MREESNYRQTEEQTMGPEDSIGDLQVLPTSTEPMSEAEFLNERTNCPENPDSGKARFDHKQNNRS